MQVKATESENEDDGAAGSVSPKIQRSKSDSASLGGLDVAEAVSPSAAQHSPARQFPLVAPDADNESSDNQNCTVS